MKFYDRLKNKLSEIFQLDQADLDFGIHRIMNAKPEEVMHFLHMDLLLKVQETFKDYKSSDKPEIKRRSTEGYPTSESHRY